MEGGQVVGKLLGRGIVSIPGRTTDLWKDLRFDCSALIGGNPFVVDVQLARNGLYINAQAHIDGGANLFAAIKTHFAYQLLKASNISFVRLPRPITPTGYNGKPGSTIDVALLLTLSLNNRHIKFPFLVTDLGRDDIIIGRKFLEHYDITERHGFGKRRLTWPEDMPPSTKFSNELFIDKHNWKRPLQVEHQEDIARRDAAFEQDEVRRNHAKLAAVNPCILKTTQPQRKTLISRGSPWSRDLLRRLKSMEKLLQASYIDAPEPRRKKEFQSYKVDISCISAAAMTAHLETRGTPATMFLSVLFMTSIWN